MIKTKVQLKFYIAADRIINGYPIKKSMKEYMLNFIGGVKILSYLEIMRKLDYLKNKEKVSMINRLTRAYYHWRYVNLGTKLGFSIGYDTFGYGLLIPHYGTIVVNNNCKIGNYCVLHTSTCIGGGGEKIVGDGLYMGAGAKIMGSGKYGAGVTLAANAVATNGSDNNVLLVGVPSIVKRNDYPFWYIRDGKIFQDRINTIEELKKSLQVEES